MRAGTGHPARTWGCGFARHQRTITGVTRFFYGATLQQVRSVLPAELAGKDDYITLRHVRYVDLKGAGGGGRAKEKEVADWVHGHLDEVVVYWTNDRPACTILQGVIAQKIFEGIVVRKLCARNVQGQKVGLLHPSRQNTKHLKDPAYLEAVKQVHKQLRQLDEPLLQWDPWNKQWYPPERT